MRIPDDRSNPHPPVIRWLMGNQSQMAYQWIIAKSQPSREQYAAKNIRRFSYNAAEPYVPLYWNGRQRIALFPAYIFVKVRDGLWHFLNSTYGVNGIMMIPSDQRPATIDKNVIKELRARENANGCIELPEIINPDLVTLQKGDLITISDEASPFFQCDGLYNGMADKDRAMVLLNLLGKQVRVTIPSRMIEAA